MKLYSIEQGIIVAILAVVAFAQDSSSDVNVCSHKPADVVFLLDASRSIWGPDFDRQLDFVSSVVSLFHIGPDNMQVGLATYSSRVYPQFPLNRYSDKTALKTAISFVGHGKGDTNTAAAIHFMRTRMFNQHQGARHGVPHIAIILTDGRSDHFTRTWMQAQKARKEGIIIFAIGIGSKLNNDELHSIASSPSQEHVFQVDNFNALDTIKKILAWKACTVMLRASTSTSPTTTTTTTTTTTLPPTTLPSRWNVVYDYRDAPPLTINWRKTCRNTPSDVVFLVDSSKDVSDLVFWKQLKFVQEMIHVFDIGPNRTRFAVVTYNGGIQTNIELASSGDSHRELNGAVSRVVRTPKQFATDGRRDVAAALEHLRVKVLNYGVTKRAVAQVAILLLAGPSESLEAAKREADLARQQGIYLFAIGFGDTTDREELKSIANRPGKRFLVRAADVDDLSNKVNEVALTTCKLDASEELLMAADQVCGGGSSATDIIFVVDSPNAGVRNTRSVMSFIHGTVARMDVSTSKVSVGVIAGVCAGSNGFDLQTYSTKNTTVQGIDDITVVDFSKLIKRMRVKGFRKSQRVRGGGEKTRRANKKAILIIDGDLDNYLHAKKEAKKAKRRGIEVFIISVGSQVSDNKLKQLASDPVEEHFFRVKTYDRLADICDALLRSLCSVET